MIVLKNVHKKFDDEAYPLRGVSLDVSDGEVIAIMGVSGSGKSTALNCIAGIEILDDGEIIIDNESINYQNQKQVESLRETTLGIVFQQYYLLKNTSVYNQLKLVTNASDENIDKVLNQMGILEHKNKNIELCSGGQQQRVSIARAMVKHPRVLLADEPTANLDVKLALQSIQLMVTLAKENNTSVIIITHDTRLLHLCDKVYLLENGELKDYEN